MLAWLFWHSRFSEVPEDVYRENLLVFHDRIAAAAPAGYLGSRIRRYASLPWLNTPHEAYEDWYFVENSAALDPLDEAALAEFSRRDHDNVARLAATATSGLYRLRAGSPLSDPVNCSWLSKPRGEPYDTFIENLSAAGTVWTRKLVLGPALEFCVESGAAVENAQTMPGVTIRPSRLT